MPPKPSSILLSSLRSATKPPLSSNLRHSSAKASKPPFTHFSATGPHASEKLPPRVSTIDVSKIKPNETPRQRVARLREAAREARIRDLPWQDKLIEISRKWADYAHRSLVLFILGFSGLAAIFTVYVTADLIIFTRNKRHRIREKISERRSEILREALQAEGEGRASFRQELFLKRFRAVAAAEEERIAKRNFIRKAFDRIAPGIMTLTHEAITLAKLDEEMFEEMRQEEEAEGAEGDNVEQSQEVANNAAEGALVTAGAQSTKGWTSWLRWR